MSFSNSSNTKVIRRRRSELAWKKSGSVPSQEDEIVEYPPGPIDIRPSWRPINKTDKPPYSYANIIGHAILTSKERRLTLNEIYNWITENYPFYSNDTQGWQNSIRHNLSLHKSFVKIERDQCAQNPPRKGCFWTIRPGKEKFFVDNLQKPSNMVRKQHSLSHLNTATMSRRATHTSTIGNSRNNNSNNSSNSSSSNSSSGSSSSNSSIASLSPVHNTAGLFGATTDVSSTTLSEIEHAATASSSSDHLSSSSTSSPLTTFDLFCVPEISTSYNVYPEHNIELFGDQQDFYNTSSYSAGNNNNTTYANSSYAPSLCDTFSTTSSSPTTTTDLNGYYAALKPFSYTSSDSNKSLSYTMDWAFKDTFLQPPYQMKPNYFLSHSTAYQ